MCDHLDMLSAELTHIVPPSALANGTVCMLCGIAGAGKTTVAKLLESRGFVRLSIDEWIWANHGRFGMDYDAAVYPKLQVEAESQLRLLLIEMMRTRQAVVIDFSFWQRSRREAYKALIADQQRSWILLYLRVEKPVLLQRLERRRDRFDPNAAFPIGEELLDRYSASFEEPLNEGESIVHSAA
jgi:predicted kinase